MTASDLAMPQRIESCRPDPPPPALRGSEAMYEDQRGSYYLRRLHINQSHPRPFTRQRALCIITDYLQPLIAAHP